jgi:hypothetical protein
MAEPLRADRGLLGIKFWFMVFIVMAFMVAVSMAMNVLYVGQTVRAADELTRIKGFIDEVCQGNAGDYRTFQAPPIGVVARMEDCGKVMGKATVRGILGAGVAANNIKSIMSMGKDTKALKEMSGKADDLARLSGSPVKTAKDTAEMAEANAELAKTLATFEEPGKSLLHIPMPSKVATVQNRIVMALDKAHIISQDGAKVQEHVAAIYKIQGTLKATTDAAEQAKLYTEWASHAEEAYKLAQTGQRITTASKYAQGVLYTACLATSTAAAAKETDILPEAAQKGIEEARTSAQKFIQTHASVGGGVVAAMPAEAVPCFAYSLSRGANFRDLSGAMGGALSATAVNVLGGEMLGQSVSMVSDFALRCPGKSNAVAICVQKAKCEGESKGPCSACDVVSCRVPVKVESRPLDPRITARNEGDAVTVSGGVEPF